MNKRDQSRIFIYMKSESSMIDERIIFDGIYLIGGPNISYSEDATAFVVDCGDELVMIDSGVGGSVEILEKNIRELGLDPQKISTLILTHCHIDHIGGAPHFKQNFHCKLVAHERDAEAIETGDSNLTASSFYGTHFPPTTVDITLTGDQVTLWFGKQEIHCIHIPGHTPGSIASYLDRKGKRILFGQDIHGPFMKSFGSDVGQWKTSMNKLLSFKADILCEGHFGIFRSPEKVEAYIRKYLKEFS
jgi:glyoxylase-like metal-dependent hydrolase (beta-lactamase superfamily II)